MKKLLLSLSLFVVTIAGAQKFDRLPMMGGWVGDHSVAYYYNLGGSVSEDDFVIDAATGKRTKGVASPAMERMSGRRALPLKIDGAENPTYSPDSTKIAFTRDNDLWVMDTATKKETRLTSDGSDVILNGYSSWVYYEEILGRPTRYKAFWWSPDSKKIGFYRFDNTEVPFFPIYSAVATDADRSGLQLGYGQNAGGAVDLEDMSPTGGSVRMTRYPKCGDPNPKVRIGIVNLENGQTAWADFDENDDQYFGTPFWGADSKAFFIQREPRIQNTLDLYAVSPENGSKTHIYHETYKTWLDWIQGMYFGRDGLYMVRSFETGWEQIYYLSYDGKTLKRLTDGENWRTRILSVKEGKPAKGFDGTTSEVVYSAQRDSHVRTGIYLASKSSVRTISDPALSASMMIVSPDKKFVTATLSNSNTPNQNWIFNLAKPSKSFKVDDMAGPDFNPEAPTLPRIITMTTSDGLELPGLMVYPKDFDPSRKYPVHVDIYGGPDTPQVSDAFRPYNPYQWYSDNGIIECVLDCRAAGYNGRKGLDMIYKHLDEIEVKDFVECEERVATVAVDFVHDDNRGKAEFQSLLRHEAGLGHRTFECVNNQKNAIDSSQNAFHLATEVGVPRGIDDVHAVSFVHHARVLGEDGNAAFAFEVVGVHHAVHNFFTFVESSALFEKLVHQGCFTVVNVGDDGDVSDF